MSLEEFQSISKHHKLEDAQLKEELGISLRDYFASKALSLLRGTDVWVADNDADIAMLAYRLADAMLAERSKS